MAEYIKREAAYEDFEKCNGENPKWTPSRVKPLIARQKAANVAPVRHGRWEYNNSVNFWQCSRCGENAPIHGKWMQLKTHYCPNCGAKMDLEGGGGK